MTVDIHKELLELEQPITNLAKTNHVLYRKLLLLAVANEVSTDSYTKDRDIPYSFYTGEVNIEKVQEELLEHYPDRKVRTFSQSRYGDLYDRVATIADDLGIAIAEVLWDLGFKAVIPMEKDEDIILSVIHTLYPHKESISVSITYPRL